MIKKALKEITIITEDEDDNLENYLESLNYLDNIYKLITALQKDIEIDSVNFLPSFKSKFIANRLGIMTTSQENELKYFKIESPLFISDIKIVDKIKNDCADICDVIYQTNEKNILIFILK